MVDLLSLSRREMENLVVKAGFPAYRGRQLFQWCHEKNCRDLGRMTSLPAALIDFLREQTTLTATEVVASRSSADGGTVKFLLRLADGAYLETVLMSYRRQETRERHSVCVSSQVGCAMGCLFCASGKTGFQRNLTAGEIVGQVYTADDYLAAKGEAPVSNIVYMGMGEPLANLAAVLHSMDILHQGKNIGRRRMTVSTCGLIPGIHALAKEKLQITLALSLHAADDALRDKLMPINKRYPIQPLFETLDEYILATGRRVTIEYALFRDVNDRPQQAEALASLCRGRLLHINLLSGNPLAESDLQPSPPPRVHRFQEILTQAGLAVSLRESKGLDIDGACGQLRSRYLPK